MTSAQLCAGALGDPLVSITFSDNGTPLPTGSTPYTYVTDECPDDGEYTLVKRSYNCFDRTWHDIGSDHTSDRGSSFMLINSMTLPGDIFILTFSELCPGTGYEFAAWVMNVLKPTSCGGKGIDPNLTFTIETTNGDRLATYNTKDIAITQTAGWRQLGVTFQTPAGINTVVARITNNAGGGCGNDLAIDDITLKACGPSIVSTIEANNSNSISACIHANTSFQLSSDIPPAFLQPSMQWQQSIDSGMTWIDIPGAVDRSFVTRPSTEPGLFKYRMTISEASVFQSRGCRITGNLLNIEISRPPVVLLADIIPVCTGSDVTLFADGGKTYHWTGPNGFVSDQQDPVVQKVTANNEGVYTVVVSSAEGCETPASTRLELRSPVNAVVGNDQTICEGDSVVLNASGGHRYQWTPADRLLNDTVATTVATPAHDTRYVATVINEFGCTDTAGVNISVAKKPIANAGPDKTTQAGTPVILEGSANADDVTISWTSTMGTVNSQSLRPSVTPMQTTNYTLQAISTHGCGTSTDEVLVTVYQKIAIPNAFSPNGDGINDTWIFKPSNVLAQSTTQVFNRYGQLVFSSTGNSRPWDGTMHGRPVPAGSYYYIIDPRINNEPKMTGWVLVVR